MNRTSAWSVTGLVLCVLVVGCAGPGLAPSAGPADSSRAGAQTATPKRIVGAIRGEPPTLNAIVNRASLSFSVPGSEELERLYQSGLATEDNEGKMRPLLAEAAPSIENGLWRLLDDGRMETTWKIMPGARWHDGAPLTSADLLFTMQVVRDRELVVFRDAVYDFIDTAEALDPATVIVRWRSPYIYADRLFTTVRALPLPKHLLEEAYLGDKANFLQVPFWSDEFVGSGPYKVREFVRGSHVLLVANDSYLRGRPKIDEVEVRFIPDASVMIASTLAEAVDVTMGRAISIEQAMQVRDQWRNGTVLVSLYSRYHMEAQFLNPTPASVTDVRFRKALMYGIDRQQLVDTLQFGLVPVADVLIGPANVEYKDVVSSAVHYEYDPRRALQLLAEVGYAKAPDGSLRDAANQKLTLNPWVTAANPLSNRAIFVVADYWQQLGATVEPMVIPTQRVNDREYLANFPSFFFRRQPDTVEFFRSLSSSEAQLPSNNYVGRNYARYMNPEYDALVERFFSTIPQAERIEALRNLTRLTSDQLPVLSLFYDASCVLVSSRLRGVTSEAQGWNAYEWEV